MDLTAAARNRGGAKILDPRSSSCCQRSPLSPFSLVLHVLTVSRTFWDFGSLHQKHRVGGTPGCARRDGSNGWRSPVSRGGNIGRRVCLPPPPTIALRDGSFPLLCIVTGSSLFWDIGSLYQRRCGVIISHALSRQPFLYFLLSRDNILRVHVLLTWTCSCTATLAGRLLSQKVVVRSLMVGPRAPHSSSPCNEQWEGCPLGDAL